MKYFSKTEKEREVIMAVKKRRASTKKRRVVKRRRVVVKKKTVRRGGGGLTKMSYTLSSDLAAVVGSKTATRPEVVKKIWVYIKRHDLQDKRNRRMINPDSKLGKVIGTRPVDMLKLAGHISKHVK